MKGKVEKTKIIASRKQSVKGGWIKTKKNCQNKDYAGSGGYIL